VTDDRALWARSLVKEKNRLRKGAPAAANLKDAITSIQLKDTIEGSSTVEVAIADKNWSLTDSGFFDADRNGRLDPIEVNYPEGSRYWWRLTSLNIAGQRGGAIVTMTFMERVAVHLMQHRGPLKTSRAKRTRAEFLKMLTDRVKAGGGIKFVSQELTVKQKVAAAEPEPEKSEEESREDKDRGINRSTKITFSNWDGGSVTLKPGELANAERALDEAFRHTQRERPLLALLEAGIVEAPFFRNPMDGDSSSVGFLQLLDIHGPVSKRRDIAWVTMRFLNHGFTGAGGAIALAKAHPDWSPGQIAQEVQGSAHPDRYEKVRDGAEQVLEAYGGEGGGGGDYYAQYNFEVGGPDNPRETFWDAMGRLAEEVKWALFIDGQNVYYDSEMTLIRQKPVAIVKRGAPTTLGWSATWDQRRIATELRVDLMCDPLEFRAGEVLLLEGFGPASTGSSAKLPGRWLIKDIDRDVNAEFSSFTLKQPEDPAPEPRSELLQREEDEESDSESGGVPAVLEPGMTPEEVINRIVLPLARANGVPRTVAENNAANAAHGPTVNKTRSDHQGPPSVAWAADMSNGSSPTPEMDALARELISKFDLPRLANPKATSGENAGNAVRATHDGLRFQLIYRSTIGGDHYNHVHFGVKREGPAQPSRPRQRPGRTPASGPRLR
jgi:hypothetical protein